jgi:hypothetical protein
VQFASYHSSPTRSTHPRRPRASRSGSQNADMWYAITISVSRHVCGGVWEGRNDDRRACWVDADQSCAPCGAQSIQLVPLQRDVCYPPPLSSVPALTPPADDASHVRLVSLRPTRPRQPRQRCQVPTRYHGFFSPVLQAQVHPTARGNKQD